MKRYCAGVFAISEILAVLIAGALLAGPTAQALFQVLGIDVQPTDYAAQLADPWRGALIAGIPIVSRFFWLLLFAFLILRLVHGVTPRAAGVSRGGHSWLRLLGAGLLLFAVAALPMKLIFLADAYVDIGEGLSGWQLWSQQSLTLGFLVFVLAAQVVLPPLFEEPFARGYMRVRLIRAFGAAGGVIIAGTMFMLGHGHFYQADALTLAIFGSTIFAAICWTWVAFRMGSIIPPMIAHALGNVPAPLEPDVLLATVASLIVIALIGGRTVAREFGAFSGEFGAAPKGLLVFGLALVGAALAGIVLFEGALPVVGIAALVLMIAGWIPPMRRWGEGM
ncbi:MAG: CPBP family intramembrane glutamic endopeptidase [bacterium]